MNADNVEQVLRNLSKVYDFSSQILVNVSTSFLEFYYQSDLMHVISNLYIKKKQSDNESLDIHQVKRLSDVNLNRNNQLISQSLIPSSVGISFEVVSADKSPVVPKARRRSPIKYKRTKVKQVGAYISN